MQAQVLLEIPAIKFLQKSHFMQVLAPTCSPGKFRCRSRIHSATSGAVTVILCQADTDQLGQVKARLVEGTEVLVEGGKVGARQAKEEGVRLTAEVKLPSLIEVKVKELFVAGAAH